MMKKQLPHGVSALIIAGAVLAAIAAVGLLTPKGSGGLSYPSGPRTGKLVPPLSGETLEGKPLSLKDYSGKVVLINFWATWCGPCKQEMPDLIRLHNKYKDRGFSVIGVAADDPRPTIEGFLKDNPVPYPMVLGTSEQKQAFGVRSLPTSVLVNKKGAIVFDIDGYSPSVDFGEMIEKEL